jgi:hypothetical protein
MRNFSMTTKLHCVTRRPLSHLDTQRYGNVCITYTSTTWCRPLVLYRSYAITPYTLTAQKFGTTYILRHPKCWKIRRPKNANNNLQSLQSTTKMRLTTQTEKQSLYRTLRFTYFKLIGTWRQWGCQPYPPAAFTSQEIFLVLISIEAESTPGPYCGRKDYVNEKSQWHHLGIEPATSRIVAQCLNQLPPPRAHNKPQITTNNYVSLKIQTSTSSTALYPPPQQQVFWALLTLLAINFVPRRKHTGLSTKSTCHLSTQSLITIGNPQIHRTLCGQ